jgi:hypothetical protein
MAETLGRLVLEEGLFAIFGLSILSLGWAVAAPRWLESLLQRTAVKVVLATIVFSGILWWMFILALDG